MHLGVLSSSEFGPFPAGACNSCKVVFCCVFSSVTEKDPNAEPCHWLEVEHAKRTVYAQRFTPPDGVVEPNHQNERRVSVVEFLHAQ